jgi:transcription elongation factor GreA
VIEKNDSAGEVQLGNVVTVEVDGKKKKFQILGSSETDPTQGIISRNSPIGEALLGREVGEEVEVKLPAKTVIYKILKIE